MSAPARRHGVEGVVSVDGRPEYRDVWTCCHLAAETRLDQGTRTWRMECPTCGCFSVGTVDEVGLHPFLGRCLHAGPPPAPAPPPLPASEAPCEHIGLIRLAPEEAGYAYYCPGCHRWAAVPCSPYLEAGPLEVIVARIMAALGTDQPPVHVGVHEDDFPSRHEPEQAFDLILSLSVDAYRYDAGSPAAEEEIAAWQEILDGAKRRRPRMPPAYSKEA